MEPNESYHHYHLNNTDDQPKDLTIKTAKKMKPIPPPLNLNSADKDSDTVPLTLLKEFANFATSPKSPLMLKHLPFRKRAHIISANVSVDNSEDDPSRGMKNQHFKNYRESEIAMNLSQPQSPIVPTIIDVNKVSSNNPLDLKANNISGESPEKRNKNDIKLYPPPPPPPPPPLPGLHGGKINSGVVSGSGISVSGKDSLPFSEEEYVLDLSLHPNSVLLSPAPSSLGSSREELTLDSTRASPLYQTRLWGLPWPPPIWHCFQSGTKLKLGSLWCTLEEMGPCPVDWPSELKVDQMSLKDVSVIVNFSSPTLLNCVVAEVSRAHAFLVKDRGWTAACGESLFSKYSVMCPSLQLGDIVMLPTIHRLPLPLPLPSPDICERIKRFSFPPPDDPQPPQLLSPPTTPTRKSQDCDKPKRPMNAFMLFAKRFRLELIQSHPGKDNRAISVILGEVWRTLPQEEREIYIRGARDLSEEQKLLHPDCWKRKRSHSTS